MERKIIREAIYFDAVIEGGFYDDWNQPHYAAVRLAVPSVVDLISAGSGTEKERDKYELYGKAKDFSEKTLKGYQKRINIVKPYQLEAIFALGFK